MEEGLLIIQLLAELFGLHNHVMILDTWQKKNSTFFFNAMRTLSEACSSSRWISLFDSSNPSEQAIHPNRSLNITESFDHDDGDDNDDGDGDDDGDDDDDDDDDDDLMMMMNLNKNAQIIL